MKHAQFLNSRRCADSFDRSRQDDVDIVTEPGVMGGGRTEV